ncbi:MAG TPA: hypothetical protein VJU84_00715 [Pyrinomonadaceae bacterium]|nr:hypothetical protein [Pyrinomonadaceae bacterium]
MSTRIDKSSSVIGNKITNVVREATGVDLETDLQTFRFLIQLSNGLILEMLPGDIRQCDYLPGVGSAANHEVVIDARPDIVGEKIITIATYVFGSSSASSEQPLNPMPPHPASRLYDVPRHVALIFSSGRVAINVYLCGGISELHVDSLEGLIKHFGKPWRDYWTDEILELERLHVTAK